MGVMSVRVGGRGQVREEEERGTGRRRASVGDVLMSEQYHSA
jgi:hypothetical protein